MNQPTNSIDSELDFNVTQYRDDQKYESTQVTVSCKCGRGGWIRLQKHPDMSKYISRKEIEGAIGEDEEQQLPNPGVDNFKAVERCVGRNQLRQQLRAKLLPPTKEDNDE